MLRQGTLSCRWQLQRQPLPTRRPLRPQCSGKGFGTPAQKKAPKENPSEGSADPQARRANKSKGKVQRRMPQPPSQPPQPTLAQQGAPRLDPEAGSSSISVVDEIEFEQRLKALQQEAEQRKQEISATQQQQDASAGGILDARRKAQQEDIYSNPPPLTSTLFGKKDGPDEYKDGQFGPGQVALAAVSLALVGVFVLANGSSDLAYVLNPGPRAAQQGEARKVELGDEVRAELEKQLAEYDAQLAATPESTEALEGAAVVNARLGNFEKAIEQLQQLAAAKPSDPDIWRVLGESQSALGDRAAAIASYRRAWQEVQAAPGGAARGLEVLQGLTAELVAAGQEQQAVDLVQEARALVPADAAGPDAALASGELGPVEVELLLGKVYSQWKGHVSDALAVYDGLTQSRPDDFRGYLAKGLLLRDQGRQADAQRAFIEARYLAPKESRTVVDNIINRPR